MLSRGRAQGGFIPNSVVKTSELMLFIEHVKVDYPEFKDELF
jgi:hypothetical protein